MGILDYFQLHDFHETESEVIFHFLGIFIMIMNITVWEWDGIREWWGIHAQMISNTFYLLQKLWNVYFTTEL